MTKFGLTAKYGQIWLNVAKSGQFWPNFYQDLAKIYQILAKIWPNRVSIGTLCVYIYISYIYIDLGQNSHYSAKFGQNLVNFGQIYSNLPKLSD